jgi:hypothetical protein
MLAWIAGRARNDKDRSRHLNASERIPAHRAPLVALLALASAPAAWASYGQMRLDGAAFFLVVTALYLWGIVLALALAAGLARRKWVVVTATVVTLALTVLLIVAWGDGQATMRTRPLNGPAMFVVLMLAALPLMLAAPFMQRAGADRTPFSPWPMGLVGAAMTLVPVCSIAYALLLDYQGVRIVERTRAVAPGQVQSYVDASRRKSAQSWLPTVLWNAEEEAKWTLHGLAAAGIVDSPAPLSAEDARALQELIQSSEGTKGTDYIGKIEGKLVWDRLMGAAPADRVAVAARLSQREAMHFTEYVVVPHTDWLCTPLTDPPTEQAFVRLVKTLPETDRPRFQASVREKCGRTLPPPLPDKAPLPVIPLSVR